MNDINRIKLYLLALGVFLCIVYICGYMIYYIQVDPEQGIKIMLRDSDLSM